MEILAGQIARELKNAKQCGVYEPELSRVWPASCEPREPKIAAFAELHAIAASLMRKEDVYCELSEIVAGQKPGRTSDAEIIVFDSTGIAIEDAVAAAVVYRKARAANLGQSFNFSH